MQIGEQSTEKWLMNSRNSQSAATAEKSRLTANQSHSLMTLLAQTGKRQERSFERCYEDTMRQNRCANRTADAFEDREDFEKAQQRFQRIGEKRDITTVEDTFQKRQALEQNASNPVSSRDVSPSRDDDGMESVPDESQKPVDEIVHEVVQNVSETLNINLAGDIQNISLENPSEGVIDEVAEMIHTLQSIISIIDTAVSEGESIQIGGTTIEGAVLESMEQTLTNQLFKLKYAVNVSGIALPTNNLVAEKMDRAPQGGIPVAVDLENQKMSSVQLKQIFAHMEGAEESDAEATIKKLVESLRSNMGAKVSQSEAVAISSTVTIKEFKDGNRQSQPLQLGSVNSSVMRSLLKIDGEEQITQENTKAVDGTKKLEFPSAMNLVFSKNPGEETLAQPASGNQDGTQGQIGFGKTDSSSLFHTPEASRILSKVEQSVMMQLNSRFNGMLKAGTQGNEIKIMLRPESLGEVHLKVQMEGEVVITKIRVENQQVKQIIENNLQSLKNALAEHNLETGSFSVDVGNGSLNQFKEEYAGGANNPLDRSRAVNGTEEEGDAGSVPEKSGNEETGRRYGTNTIEYIV